MEIREIPGFPNYSVTMSGRVWSHRRIDIFGRKQGGQWLKPQVVNKWGHLKVVLCKNKAKHQRLVHRLVLETYVGPCPPGMECRHLNGDPANNSLDNVCWGTHADNVQDMVRHGSRKGEKHHCAKLKTQDIKVIRYLRNVAKFTLAEIAWHFDVCGSNISLVCSRKNWSHVA